MIYFFPKKYPNKIFPYKILFVKLFPLNLGKIPPAFGAGFTDESAQVNPGRNAFTTYIATRYDILLISKSYVHSRKYA